ncbi:sperm microtubule inner protein 6 [Strix aluco]|uniref:sperm microtubule inner protein 6 n=1 Tax=Strix aluco TaxID=111821 RepID=UPI003DA57019
MFLFSKKHKTPVSTYTDSYRPPCSVKKTIQKQTSQQPCSENKFVTPGLMMPLVQNPASQGQTELPIKAAMQESHRNTINPTAYWPKKYWLARSKDKYKPVFVNKDKYLTWRTGPYNSTVWNRYLSCVPLPPKETRMETFLHSIPVLYSLKPTCINQCEREVATDMLPRLPVYSVTGRGPYWGYYSPCSGCHHCQQGMDYYVDGASAIRGQLHTLEERAVRSIPCCSYSPRATFCASTHRLWSFFLYRNLRLNGHDQGGQDTIAVLGCGVCCCYPWRSSCQIYSKDRCFYAWPHPAVLGTNLLPGHAVRYAVISPVLHPLQKLKSNKNKQGAWGSPQMSLCLSLGEMILKVFSTEKHADLPGQCLKAHSKADGGSCMSTARPQAVQVFCSSSLLEFHPPTADNFICSPRWRMSHFKKTGGVQRDSYTILPEFTSEAYSAPCCWLAKFLGKGGETSAAIGLVGTLTALRGWYPATTHKLETKKAHKEKLSERSNTSRNRSNR